MGVRERGEQFRRLARRAVADLLDQRDPVGRLSLTQVLMTAGDTVFAVSLAGSLFFSISPTAAKGKVLLYLLLTAAPFAVVAPFLGPIVDRSRNARRATVATSAFARAVLCIFLVGQIHTLLLFPLAFAMLVLSKVYLVTKGALVPEMSALSDARTGTDAHADLASINARLGLLSSIAGFLAALPAIAILKLAGSGGVVLFGVAVFSAAGVSALRLPVRRRRRGGEAPEAVRQLETDEMPAPARSPLALDDADADDLALFRPTVSRPVQIALASMATMKAVTGFMTFLFAFVLRRPPHPAPTWWFGLLIAAVTIGAVAGVLSVAQLRRVLSESQIMVIALWAIVLTTVGASMASGRVVQVVVAFVVGVAGSVSKPSFDALVQRDVDEAQQGRTFARFETQLQLAWVLGALVSVILTLSLPLGDVMMAVGAAIGAVSHVARRRSGNTGLLPVV